MSIPFGVMSASTSRVCTHESVRNRSSAHDAGVTFCIENDEFHHVKMLCVCVFSGLMVSVYPNPQSLLDHFTFFF